MAWPEGLDKDGRRCVCEEDCYSSSPARTARTARRPSEGFSSNSGDHHRFRPSTIRQWHVLTQSVHYQSTQGWMQSMMMMMMMMISIHLQWY